MLCVFFSMELFWSNSTLQTIKVKNDYLFEDVKIFQEIEKYHINKSNNKDSQLEEQIKKQA